MNKLAIVKGIVNFTVGASVTKVVNDVITNNTSPEDLTDKVEIFVGSAVLGSMVASHAKDHVSNGMDKMIASWQNRKLDTATTAE